VQAFLKLLEDVPESLAVGQTALFLNTDGSLSTGIILGIRGGKRDSLDGRPNTAQGYKPSREELKTKTFYYDALQVSPSYKNGSLVPTFERNKIVYELQIENMRLWHGSQVAISTGPPQLCQIMPSSSKVFVPRLYRNEVFNSLSELIEVSNNLQTA
jgi:hypothetical protein